MKSFPLFAAGLFLFPSLVPSLEIAGRLDFVSDPGWNRLNITISVSGLTDSDISQVTGHLEARMVLDEGSESPQTLDFTGGRFFFSDTSFVFRFGFFPLADLNAGNLSGTLLTPEPPGLVDSDGTFDAGWHDFAIDRGRVAGNAFQVGPFSFDFEDAPISGPGVGQGQVSVERAGNNWLVAVNYPVNIEQIIDMDGVEVTIQVHGTMRAVGLLEASPRTGGYEAWVASLDPPLPEHLRGRTDRNGPLGLANLLFYATGKHPLSGASPAPVLILRPGPTPAWVAVHSRRRDAGDALLRLSGAFSLEEPFPWPTVPVLAETVTPLDEWTDRVETVLDTPPETRRYFMRLEATALP